MAKLERRVNEDFSRLLQRLNDGILSGSVSATLEIRVIFEVGLRNQNEYVGRRGILR